MNFKIAFVLAVFSAVIVSINAVETYAEQYDDCLRDCRDKFGVNGYIHKKYQQQGHECFQECDVKYSPEYGSYGFYPEKEAECHQGCDEQYAKHGPKYPTVYPQQKSECKQRCTERYGFRTTSTEPSA